MPETVRELKLSIYIDTTKQTVRREFETLGDLIEFYNEYFETEYSTREVDFYADFGEDL